jgi:hypothetical protein
MEAFLQDPGHPANALGPTLMNAPFHVATQVRVCPFCGLSTETPHETQATCIAALQAEVARMRELLDHLKPAGAAPTLSAEPPKRT